MNNYIFHPHIDLDLAYLRELVSRENKPIPGFREHHRRVSDDPYLSRIREQVPILSPIYNIYNFDSTRPLKPHIDSDRQVTLNIPLKNTVGTSTIFYEDTSVSPLTNYSEWVLDFVPVDNLVEIFRFTLDEPTLMNTKVIHSVVHEEHSMTRTSISWSFLPDVSYDEAVKFFESMRVL